MVRAIGARRRGFELFQSSLVRASVLGGKIYPKFMKLEGHDVEVAQAIIDTYSSMVGMRKGMLDEALRELEAGRDYKLIRGLSALLDRRCRFSSTATLDPVKTRAMVFAMASGRYLERDTVMAEAAQRLGVTVQELEESLWSDLEENVVLIDFQQIDAVSLVKQYNLSLAQTLLLRSASMTFSVSDHWKEIFRAIKWLGLMYFAESRGQTMSVEVMGPLSLTKLTDRYGSSMAKLFEQIARCNSWNVSADVVSPNKQRMYKLELSSERHGSLLYSEAWSENPFDSEAERRFYEDFVSVNTGWEIVREPAPVKVGSHVFIPDFGLSKYGHTVYLEVVGFWTPSYLKAKQEKLREARDLDMIIAVDEELGPVVLSGDHVIKFKNRVPVDEVVRYLKARERGLLQATVKEASLRVRPWGDVVKLDELAERNGLPAEVLMEVITKDGIAGYRVLGEEIVREEFIKQLEGELGDLDGRPYLEVEAFLDKKGIKSCDAFLRALGYKVVWRSLDPGDARVLRMT
ncbi:MAG: DUF790 family protein [TACK group archaeon]|nr:DUF790 family protein [TACK group archaeon]